MNDASAVMVSYDAGDGATAVIVSRQCLEARKLLPTLKDSRRRRETALLSTTALVKSTDSRNDRIVVCVGGVSLSLIRSTIRYECDAYLSLSF
jgi:hypothetical protein